MSASCQVVRLAASPSVLHPRYPSCLHTCPRQQQARQEHHSSCNAAHSENTLSRAPCITLLQSHDLCFHSSNTADICQMVDATDSEGCLVCCGRQTSLRLQETKPALLNQLQEQRTTQPLYWSLPPLTSSSALLYRVTSERSCL